MSPQLAAGLTGFVGICLIAGWVAGFRNRSYVGWLGLAFLALSGFLVALGKVREAQEFGMSSPRLALLTKLLLLVWIGAFVLAFVAAVRETSQRLKELRASHEAAAEGFLEIVRAAQQKEGEAQAEQPAGEGSAGEEEP